MSIITEKTQEFVGMVLDDFGDMVYRLALSQTKNLHHAEDIYQEVFLSLVQQERRFDSQEHLKAWLIRVTLNASHKLFRSSWMRRTVPLEELAQPDPIPLLDEQSEVFEAVMGLPRKYRTVIHLYYYEGFSHTEIASLLQENPATVRSQLYRARNLLKNQLGGNVHHEECKGEL